MLGFVLAVSLQLGVPFPLTLALSPRERGPLPSGRDDSPSVGLFPALPTILPLPKGRGEGEGSVRVAGSLEGLVAASDNPIVAENSMATWKYGVAQAKITPTNLFWMGGLLSANILPRGL
jgi:hypothetical protein